MKRLILCILTVAIVVPLGLRAHAQADFTGPVPYLSSADIPAGFYADTPTIEDLEDASLGFGISASTGAVLAPQILTDSVDADDGVIDGLGNDGHSWSIFPQSSVTFTFPIPLPTAAALVVTDTGGNGSTTISAFGPGMTPLGSVGPFQLSDGDDKGMTAEDRFFGARHTAGILAITVSHTNQGVEVDHIQFGSRGVVPAIGPAGIAALSALLLLAARRRLRA